MTEHIAFENLPNATGKWDEMRNGVIKKVREKMKIQSEESKGFQIVE